MGPGRLSSIRPPESQAGQEPTIIERTAGLGMSHLLALNILSSLIPGMRIGGALCMEEPTSGLRSDASVRAIHGWWLQRSRGAACKMPTSRPASTRHHVSLGFLCLGLFEKLDCCNLQCWCSFPRKAPGPPFSRQHGHSMSLLQ